MKGKIIITTQPADQASEMLRLIEEKGAVAYSLPMIETRTLFLSEQEIRSTTLPGACDLLIFTSKKGVKGFFENISQINESVSLPSDLKIAVVGNATASELEKYHQKASYINPGNDAEDMAKFLVENIIQPQHNIWLALGNRAPDYLEKVLETKASVRRINVYETIWLKPTNEEAAQHIRSKKADMCIFTSPSGFFAFCDAFNDIKGLNLASIGNTTAAAIKNAGYQAAVIAPAPSPQSMIDALEMFFKEIK
jgi:uroporphyrinogen-III synthase